VAPRFRSGNDNLGLRYRAGPGLLRISEAREQKHLVARRVFQPG
jgi:hypothetical protein